ncbi:MAG: hypothetical protein ACLPZM_01575 [Thermoplasmata archaeon]
MSRALLALLMVLVLLPSAIVGVSLVAPAVRAAPVPAGKGVTANITGPSVLATGSNHRYLIQATGGPAVLPNGTIVGNLTYYAAVSANDLTGVTITPTSAALLNNTPGQPLLEVGSVAQTITISVMVSSVLNQSNSSVNLTYTVQAVQPYVVAAEIVNAANVTVGGFPVLVDLDGTQIGNVSVPSIQPHAAYNLSYDYATLGLSVGYHTFTLSLVLAHGLLRFENGSSSYSETIYIPGPAPDYTLWYATGAVAFIGVLFIFGARLGARRRSAPKK